MHFTRYKRATQPKLKRSRISQKLINNVSDNSRHSKTAMPFAFRKLLGRLAHAEDFTPDKLIPVGLLVVFSLVGAAVFHELEKDTLMANSTNETWSNCDPDAHPNTFWKALYFAGTVYTTIGYGNIYPCTGAAKVVTVVYAIVGIPLTVVVLDNLGLLLATIANTVWVESRCCCCCMPAIGSWLKAKLAGMRRENKGKHMDPENQSGCANEEVEVVVYEQAKHFNLPVWIGLVVLFGWIFISAWFFSGTETSNGEGWGFANSVYFMFISVTTVGFGDFSPRNFQLATVQIAFLLVGLSLFSMCINLVQQTLEAMTDRLVDKIAEEYKLALEKGGVDPTVENHEDEKMNEIMKTEIGWVRFLLSKHTRQNLLNQYENRSKMRLASTQTERFSLDKAVAAFPDMEHKYAVADEKVLKLFAMRKYVPKMGEHMVASTRNGTDEPKRVQRLINVRKGPTYISPRPSIISKTPFRGSKNSATRSKTFVSNSNVRKNLVQRDNATFLSKPVGSMPKLVRQSHLPKNDNDPHRTSINQQNGTVQKTSLTAHYLQNFVANNSTVTPAVKQGLFGATFSPKKPSLSMTDKHSITWDGGTKTGDGSIVNRDSDSPTNIRYHRGSLHHSRHSHDDVLHHVHNGKRSSSQPNMGEPVSFRRKALRFLKEMISNSHEDLAS